MDNLAWRTSTYSGGEGNCVEVADNGHRVLVRDTKDRTGAMLRLTPTAWRRFAKQVKADASLASDPGQSCRRALSRLRVPAFGFACYKCYGWHGGRR